MTYVIPHIAQIQKGEDSLTPYALDENNTPNREGGRLPSTIKPIPHISQIERGRLSSPPRPYIIITPQTERGKATLSN